MVEAIVSVNKGLELEFEVTTWNLWKGGQEQYEKQSASLNLLKWRLGGLGSFRLTFCLHGLCTSRHIITSDTDCMPSLRLLVHLPFSS